MSFMGSFEDVAVDAGAVEAADADEARPADDDEYEDATPAAAADEAADAVPAPIFDENEADCKLEPWVEFRLLPTAEEPAGPPLLQLLWPPAPPEMDDESSTWDLSFRFLTW